MRICSNTKVRLSLPLTSTTLMLRCGQPAQPFDAESMSTRRLMCKACLMPLRNAISCQRESNPPSFGCELTAVPSVSKVPPFALVSDFADTLICVESEYVCISARRCFCTY